MTNFYKKKLDNGLTILFESRSQPLVSISASVNFGSAFESSANKGYSHFIEHLMFKGTKTRSYEQIAKEIEKKGGMLNAFTSEELTSYWNKLPSKHWISGLQISSDLILNPKFDSAEFEKEKNVIIEEIKMYHDNPHLHVFTKIKELLYKKPFGLSIAGNAENIRKATKQEIISLFSENYSTNAMILAVVGKANFEEICSAAEKLFPEKNRKAIFYSPLKINKQEVEIRQGLDQSHFIFGFHSPCLNDVKRYDYELAGCYLFQGMSSVLFNEIREKRALAYSVKGDFDMGKDYGYGMIYTGTTKEKIKLIKEIILKEFKNLKNLKQKDFEECKEQLIGSRKVEEEDSANAMNNLAIEEFAGNASEYYNFEERIKAVKLENIRNIRLNAFSCFSLIP